MTIESWAGWYRDHLGSDAATVFAGGGVIKLRIRGVEFEGKRLDDLRPAAEPLPDGAPFALANGALTDCVLEWDQPVTVTDGGEDGAERPATLSCLFSLRRTDPDVHLALHLDGALYESARAERDFTAALAAIRNVLPEDVHLRAPAL
ncbi:DUF6304 family protein [Streptomyces sp. NBC_01218]|uniref:DUF6304 family protein n=1 Tax=unclassified Streptomyces TaxID=2593676 RepID=UPI0023B90694|nr:MULTISPECIES: DUF6304 family protein [unclassified Streptomyces]WEH39715.1 DUF6304 family protein [Streptomyces sp. AM 2-1-1]WSQ51405.1 DUF6304 family protein [Streptomyces sp. NBC_01218]